MKVRTSPRFIIFGVSSETRNPERPVKRLTARIAT
jgi:hypothetical protein